MWSWFSITSKRCMITCLRDILAELDGRDEEKHRGRLSMRKENDL